MPGPVAVALAALVSGSAPVPVSQPVRRSSPMSWWSTPLVRYLACVSSASSSDRRVGRRDPSHTDVGTSVTTRHVGSPRVQRVGANDRACCMVEMNARVDSAPWLRLTPIGCKPVVAAAGWLDRTSCARCRCRPSNHSTASARPATSVGPGQPERPRAGIGHRCHLDRLLVELRARSPGPRPPTPVTERCPRACLEIEQPVRASSSPRSQVAGPVERGPGGDHRLGDRGVGVGKPRLGPAPVAGRERPDHVEASASSARAARGPGSTPSTSAAPSAAKAIARGHGDR